MRKTSARLGATLAALALALARLGGCATNPATGEKNFMLVSEAKEQEIGDQAAPEAVKQFGGLYPDEQAQALVRDVGMKTAVVSGRPHLPWTYQVVNAPEPNAFALPGGHIYITQGLLRLLTNESQLAGVLGHETGHCAARHQAQQISQSTALQTAVGVGGTAAAAGGGGVAAQAAAGGAQAAGQLILLKYSRDMESQADELGMKYEAAAGYDPRGMTELLGILQQAAQAHGGGGSGLPSFFETHPATEDRIKDTQAYIAKNFQPAQLDLLVRDTPRFDAVIAGMRARPEPAAAPPVPARQAQPGARGR
jgi:predicted Zn-dependent protease